MESSATNAVETSLTNSEISRYGRQMILDRIGREGQEAIKNSKVSLRLLLLNLTFCFNNFLITYSVSIRTKGLSIDIKLCVVKMCLPKALEI